MTKMSWKGVVELVGIFAVVASLLFVGVQLQQDQDIAEAQVYADFDDTQIALSELILENYELWSSGSSGGQLSESEEQKFTVIAYAVIAKYDGFISRAYRLDTRPPEEYAAMYAVVLLTYPGVRSVFEHRCQRTYVMHDASSSTCDLVARAIKEFEEGTRTMPDVRYLTP